MQHRKKRRKITKTRAMRFISDALAAIATVIGLMAFNWAFWVDGDAGPSKEFDIMIVITFILAAVSFLIDYRRTQILRERRLKRMAREAREQIRQEMQRGEAG